MFSISGADIQADLVHDAHCPDPWVRFLRAAACGFSAPLPADSRRWLRIPANTATTHSWLYPLSLILCHCRRGLWSCGSW